MSLFSALSPEEWAGQLCTRWAGKGLMDYHEELASTNSRLKELAREGAPGGSLCLCHTQTAGRGRLKRSWLAAPGETLTFSLLIKPAFDGDDAEDAKKLPLCTFAAALAVCAAIKQLCPELSPKIKWPNDIVIHGQKCTGILSELVMDPDGKPCVIMGVGINVKQPAFPEEISATAGSLRTALSACGASSPAPELLPLLASFLEEMETAMTLLEKSTPDFLALCKSGSATLGRKVQVIGRDESFVGLAEDMDEGGALLVRDESGTLRRVLSGDVSVRGLMGYI